MIEIKDDESHIEFEQLNSQLIKHIAIKLANHTVMKNVKVEKVYDAFMQDYYIKLGDKYNLRESRREIIKLAKSHIRNFFEEMGISKLI